MLSDLTVMEVITSVRVWGGVVWCMFVRQNAEAAKLRTLPPVKGEAAERPDSVLGKAHAESDRMQ